MSDIPDDIRATAVKVYDAYYSNRGESLIDLIASAIAAERERCAKIAEDWWSHHEEIAAAIRTPTEGR